MSGGPITPSSVYPVTAGKVWTGFHVGAGANSKRDYGIQVMASLDANATVELRFLMPPSALPTGTCTLRLLALANATSGAAKINPKWVSVAMSENPSGATPVAEGVQTLTWVGGNNDDYLELKVALDADTPVAGEVIVLNLVFETSGYTLAQIATFIPSVIFE